MERKLGREAGLDSRVRASGCTTTIAKAELEHQPTVMYAKWTTWPGINFFSGMYDTILNYVKCMLPNGIAMAIQTLKLELA